MKDTNGKELLVGILSKDGLTVTLFEDYEKILGNGVHKAEMVYEDGHTSLLVVNIFEETIDEPLPLEPEKQDGNKLIIPLVCGAFILIILIAYLVYKKIKNRRDESWS